MTDKTLNMYHKIKVILNRLVWARMEFFIFGRSTMTRVGFVRCGALGGCRWRQLEVCAPVNLETAVNALQVVFTSSFALKSKKKKTTLNIALEIFGNIFGTSMFLHWRIHLFLLLVILLHFCKAEKKKKKRWMHVPPHERKKTCLSSRPRHAPPPSSPAWPSYDWSRFAGRLPDPRPHPRSPRNPRRTLSSCRERELEHKANGAAK